MLALTSLAAGCVLVPWCLAEPREAMQDNLRGEMFSPAKTLEPCLHAQ